MIIVHGGAGKVGTERHARLREAVRAAATVGHDVLARGGSALDAVVAAVRVLEDDPELNAGTGSALTCDGTVETDAALMDGATQRVGAVAAVPDLGNAITLARAVLDAGEHVLLAGSSAWTFARTAGIAPAPPGSLITARARARLAEHLTQLSRASSSGATIGTDAGDTNVAESDVSGTNVSGTNVSGTNVSGTNVSGTDGGGEREGGTVGAVARDRQGRFAAATSTGGIVGKRPGRVGDSPLAGAGTWADARVAISATGDGEAIIRVALAHDLATRVRAGASLRVATTAALRELAAVTGGSAGIIAIDATGSLYLQLSETMPVAWSDARGAIHDAMGARLDPLSM